MQKLFHINLPPAEIYLYGITFTILVIARIYTACSCSLEHVAIRVSTWGIELHILLQLWLCDYWPLAVIIMELSLAILKFFFTSWHMLGCLPWAAFLFLLTWEWVPLDSNLLLGRYAYHLAVSHFPFLSICRCASTLKPFYLKHRNHMIWYQKITIVRVHKTKTERGTAFQVAQRQSHSSKC